MSSGREFMTSLETIETQVTLTYLPASCETIMQLK